MEPFHAPSLFLLFYLKTYSRSAGRLATQLVYKTPERTNTPPKRGDLPVGKSPLHILFVHPRYCRTSSVGRFRICARETANGSLAVFVIWLLSDKVKVSVAPAS